jgi:hypothetical protein
MYISIMLAKATSIYTIDIYVLGINAISIYLNHFTLTFQLLFGKAPPTTAKAATQAPVAARC